MLKQRWKKEEMQDLRKQVKSKIPRNNIIIGERSKGSVSYKLAALRLKTKWWKRSEIKFLKVQIRSVKEIGKVIIQGRSKIAIRNKSLRLKIWKTKKRKMKSWTMKEIRLLRHLVQDCGYTAKQAASNGYFPSRSKDSIGQQMRRFRLKK